MSSSCLLADNFLFWLLQVAVVLLAAFSWIREWIAGRTAGRGGAVMQIERGDASMNVFYVIAFAVINGPLIAIDSSVDAARDYRVLWIVIDTIAVVSVCLFNAWFRNRLVELNNYPKKNRKAVTALAMSPMSILLEFQTERICPS